jgi:hypothetical protein
MLMAYLSIDPVNTKLFLELASNGPHEPRALEPRDNLPEGTALVLVDWDLLPATGRLDAVKRLRSRPNAPMVAVHSYHVPDGDWLDLNQMGVSVYRTLAEALWAWGDGAAGTVPVQEPVRADESTWHLREQGAAGRASPSCTRPS